MKISRYFTSHLTRGTADSAIALSALLMAVGASAQAFPDRPIKLVVPFGAGSFPDIVARVVSEKMTVGLGQPVVVEDTAAGMLSFTGMLTCGYHHAEPFNQSYATPYKFSGTLHRVSVATSGANAEAGVELEEYFRRQ